MDQNFKIKFYFYRKMFLMVFGISGMLIVLGLLALYSKLLFSGVIVLLAVAIFAYSLTKIKILFSCNKLEVGAVKVLHINGPAQLTLSLKADHAIVDRSIGMNIDKDVNNITVSNNTLDVRREYHKDLFEEDGAV